MTSNPNQALVEKALLEALRISAAPALKGLAIPAYRREWESSIDINNICNLKIYKKGFRTYKRRSPLPSYTAPSIDVEAVRIALQDALTDSGFEILQVVDYGNYLELGVKQYE